MSPRPKADLLRQYQRWYTLLRPTKESTAGAARIWDAWEANGDDKRPDVDAVAQSTAQAEVEFFRELVSIVSELTGKDLNADYCPFLTNHYNFSAVTAADGYIVLVDESFTSVMWALIMAGVLHAQAEDQDALERAFRPQFHTLIEQSVVQRAISDVSRVTSLLDALKQDYPNSIFANYVFQSIKVFILGHELGHHALGHGAGTLIERFAISGHIVECGVDARAAWEDEFQADEFGYRVYRAATVTKAERPRSYFQYLAHFGPLLFFDLCEGLDRFRESCGETLNGTTHPPHAARRQRLIATFAIDDCDPMYVEVRRSLGRILMRDLSRGQPLPART